MTARAPSTARLPAWSSFPAVSACWSAATSTNASVCSTSSSTPADCRAALEATMEESDGLIRTFDALLMIARAESGHARENLADFDAAEIARGVGDLYEPLADERGLALRVEAPGSLPAHGNRELV